MLRLNRFLRSNFLGYNLFLFRCWFDILFFNLRLFNFLFLGTRRFNLGFPLGLLQCLLLIPLSLVDSSDLLFTQPSLLLLLLVLHDLLAAFLQELHFVIFRHRAAAMHFLHLLSSNKLVFQGQDSAELVFFWFFLLLGGRSLRTIIWRWIERGAALVNCHGGLFLVGDEVLIIMNFINFLNLCLLKSIVSCCGNLWWRL